LEDRLECSRATANRVIRYMRDRLGAPIEYDRNAEGYRYVQEGEHPYELPGLWFNASELFALLTVQRLLREVQPGLLDGHLMPLRERLERILSQILVTGRHIQPHPHFEHGFTPCRSGSLPRRGRPFFVANACRSFIMVGLITRQPSA
jgi:predicted DNA-binding transcriptional regulator YafY